MFAAASLGVHVSGGSGVSFRNNAALVGAAASALACVGQQLLLPANVANDRALPRRAPSLA